MIVDEQVHISFCEHLALCSSHGECYSPGDDSEEYCVCYSGFKGDKCSDYDYKEDTLELIHSAIDFNKIESDDESELKSISGGVLEEEFSMTNTRGNQPLVKSDVKTSKHFSPPKDTGFRLDDFALPSDVTLMKSKHFSPPKDTGFRLDDFALPSDVTLMKSKHFSPPKDTGFRLDDFALPSDVTLMKSKHFSPPKDTGYKPLNSGNSEKIPVKDKSNMVVPTKATRYKVANKSKHLDTVDKLSLPHDYSRYSNRFGKASVDSDTNYIVESMHMKKFDERSRKLENIEANTDYESDDWKLQQNNFVIPQVSVDGGGVSNTSISNASSVVADSDDGISIGNGILYGLVAIVPFVVLLVCIYLAYRFFCVGDKKSESSDVERVVCPDVEPTSNPDENHDIAQDDEQLIQF